MKHRQSLQEEKDPWNGEMWKGHVPFLTRFCSLVVLENFWPIEFFVGKRKINTELISGGFITGFYLWLVVSENLENIFFKHSSNERQLINRDLAKALWSLWRHAVSLPMTSCVRFPVDSKRVTHAWCKFRVVILAQLGAKLLVIRESGTCIQLINLHCTVCTWMKAVSK